MAAEGPAASGVAGAVGAYFIFPHVQSRVQRFLDPTSGDSYQVSVAIVGGKVVWSEALDAEAGEITGLGDLPLDIELVANS